MRCCLCILIQSEKVASLQSPCNVFHFVFFSFYDKKKFSSKKEQKTIDASEKVSASSQVLLVYL